MNLLLLEADARLGLTMVNCLQAAGHGVRWCQCIAQSEQAPARAATDLAVVGHGLPDGDGLALVRRWRSEGLGWPVIMLTAQDEAADRIQGLRAGADDSLSQPFDLHELAERVLAVARRGVPRAPALPRSVGELQIDAAARLVRRAGAAVELTAMEWTVLSGLARQPGRIWSRSAIDDWLHDAGVSAVRSNSLEVIVSRLRKKLGAQCISTHRHLGYRLDG